MRLLLTLAAGIVALLIWEGIGCDGWAKSLVAPTAGAVAAAVKPIELPHLTSEHTRDLPSRLADEHAQTLLLSQLDNATAATASAPRSSTWSST